MLSDACIDLNSISNCGTIENVYLFLQLVNIRDERLLFLVLQAFRVLIMHELDYRKNLLQNVL